MYSSHPKPFFHPCVYGVLDLLYVVFAVLYLIGDADHMDNFLKYVKAVPIWLMIVQLCSVCGTHPQIKTIMIGLFFGSVGDMCLLWSQYDILFGIGALAFLVGHVFYVTAFVFIARDLIESNKVQIRDVLRLFPLFILIWLILLIFSFWSISTINAGLDSGDYIRYVMDVYGTILVLAVLGGFFFYFTTYKVSSDIYWAGLLFMFGQLIFFASDNFLAHEKYNTWYSDRVSASTNTYFIMITYYVAQFMIGKGAFFVGLHYVEEENSSSGRVQVQTDFKFPEVGRIN